MREAGGLCTHGSLGRFVRSFLKAVLFYRVDIHSVISPMMLCTHPPSHATVPLSDTVFHFEQEATPVPIARAAAGLPAMQATHSHPARAPLHVPANDKKVCD